MLDLFVNTTDEARDILTNTTNSISLTNGKTYTVFHKVHDSMKDLKIKTELSGLAGADCIICDSRKADWKDAKKVEAGFPINRTAATTKEIYADLLKRGNGKLVRRNNDYCTRKGLTKKPRTSSDQHCICITHSLINGLGWCTKVMYRWLWR